MNSVVRQLLEQNTDVVMVDTGDSYEGICRYFKGTYITYSKEKPISMNPFKITDTEYAQNFGEKKNFLKSLIFLIFKGSDAPTKIEDKIINQTIVEYYESYFTPFKEFTDAERDQLRKRLLLEDKKNGIYEKHSKELEEKYGRPSIFAKPTSIWLRSRKKSHSTLTSPRFTHSAMLA
jgi:type IV secretory pathway VirB4 component